MSERSSRGPSGWASKTAETAARTKGRSSLTLPGPENSIGKVVAGQTLQEVATFATEIQGQGGTLTNPDQADWGAKFQAMMLRSLGVRIEGGTDEILKNIIAERVLGLPGDIRVDRDVPFSEIPSGG